MRWAEKGYTRAKRAKPDQRCGAQRSALHQACKSYWVSEVNSEERMTPLVVCMHGFDNKPRNLFIIVIKKM